MFLLSLLACIGSVNEDNFLEKYARSLCSFHEECNQAVFLEEWDDVPECVDDTLDLYDDLDIDFEDCDFDKDKAKECLDKLGDATKDCDTDDVADADECGEVFDCVGGGGIGPAVVTIENFSELYFEAYCGAGCTADLSDICDTRFDTGTSTSGNNCDFDPVAAAGCVDVNYWSCEPLIDGSEDTYPKQPADCANVCG